MKEVELLSLAALLHDIGKFRMRRPRQQGQHQEHSHLFVVEDFKDFFSPCGDILANAILHHHPDRNPECRPHELEHMIEKQVILADWFSARERDAEDRPSEHYTRSPLVSILSRLEGAKNGEFRHGLRALRFDDSETIIPSQTVEVNQDAYGTLWDAFLYEFAKVAIGNVYTSAFYQTCVALLHKYTARIPSATSTGAGDERTVPDISLYDHLRTTAAIAACIGREFGETDVDSHLRRHKGSESQEVCLLIKGDISGIQSFLYQVVSEGAARELRGRSFYLQLLTESIAQWVLRQFELPITNLLLATGGHFYILAPYSEAVSQLHELRKTISQKLWQLHKGDISFTLAGIPIRASDFAPNKFSKKWDEVATSVNKKKQQKWSDMGYELMYKNLFVPRSEEVVDWKFDELGRRLHDQKREYLVLFEVPPSPVPDKPTWRSALKAFGLDVHICSDKEQPPSLPAEAERVIVYRMGDTDFLNDAALQRFAWGDTPVSYDFRIFRPVAEKADYDDLADASEGVKWLGVLRMDVDDLGKIFKTGLGNHATISRLASLSGELCYFFEGYIAHLCRQYNEIQSILELLYAGGDDLFIVGGWSALPEIARDIRSEFRKFVTGDHVTLSAGIAIEHRKFPLYQFATLGGTAEKSAKALPCKDAISFLRNPMKWKDFHKVCERHQDFLAVVAANRNPLPHGVLTRLSQLYSEEELEGHRWAWRSLYYFHRLKQRYGTHTDFIEDLRQTLNHEDPSVLRDFIHVITRWTALRVRD